MADLDALVKDTVKTVGRCISKPPMAPKLLVKPPFRFLHDVVTELIRSTGFLEGLYTPEEKDSGNMKDKALKMQFLQKAIDATIFTIGKSLAARPSKIVAGHEPENTNIWLQAMAYAVRKKLDSSDAVKRVLAGERPSKSSKDKKASKHESEPTASEPKPEEEAPATEEQPRRARPESARKRGTSATGSRELPERPGMSRRGRRPDAASDAADESPAEAPTQSEPEQQPETHAPRRNQAENDRTYAEATGGPSTAEGRAAADADDADADADRAEDRRRNLVSQRGSRNRSSDTSGGAEPETSQAPLPADQPLPGNVQRRLRERPSSARPAPPKRRKAPGAPSDGSDSRGPSARDEPTVQVIQAGEADEDADDFTVTDAQPKEEMDVALAQDLPPDGEDADGEQGVLMRKIMAKKAQERGNDEDQNAPTAGQRRLEREQAEREVAQLREAVQTLCRAANPLGKVIDYIQEDVDSMRKEMITWKTEVEEHAAALSDLDREADNALEPLKSQLSDLEQQVKDREGMIQALRARAFENEHKIQRLLSGAGSQH